MLNFNPVLTPILHPDEAPRLDDESLRRNQRALAAHLDDLTYVRTILPASCFTDGGAVLGGSEAVQYLAFPDGVPIGRTRAQIAIPPTWRDGIVRLTMFYGGAVASTNNIRWTLHRRVMAVGADYAVTDAAVNQLTPGPAAVTTWARHTFSLVAPVTGAHRLLGFRLLRDGTHADDTYAGTAHVLMFILRFVPAIAEAELPKPESWWEV